MNRGLWAAIACYVMWGLLPLYWKALAHIPAHEILAHRMTWSLGFCLVVLALSGQRTLWKQLRAKPSMLGTYGFTALLLSINWFVYIWATTHGHVLDASLGYFINPLFSVFLGVVVLHEKPRPLQWAAIGIALVGVIWLTIIHGRVPVIALALAGSFGIYGLAKKRSELSSVQGLTLETAVLFVPAAAFLLFQDARGVGSFGHTSVQDGLLLAFSGVVTALPLMFFAMAARRLPLNQLGFLQFIAPILQFSLGIIAFGETLSSNRLVGYVVIWIALTIFVFDNIRGTKRYHRGKAHGVA